MKRILFVITALALLLIACQAIPIEPVAPSDNYPVQLLEQAPEVPPEVESETPSSMIENGDTTQGELLHQPIPEPWETFFELRNYFEKYDIGILHMVGLTTQSWANIEEIGLDEAGRPIVERIMRFYQIHYSSRMDEMVRRGELMTIDESLRGDNFLFPDGVEEFLMFRFGVNGEFLRTSERFDTQSGLYIIPYVDGFGGGAAPYLVSVARSGDEVTLIYYLLDIETARYGPIYQHDATGALALTNWETQWELLIRHDGDSFQYVSNQQIG